MAIPQILVVEAQEKKTIEAYNFCCTTYVGVQRGRVNENPSVSEFLNYCMRLLQNNE